MEMKSHSTLPPVGYAAAPESAMLPISDIIVDGSIHPRMKPDVGLIKRLTQALKDGAPVPKPLVFAEDNELRLVDGFARLEAHKAAGNIKIEVEIRQGTLREAVLAAIKINVTHGRTLNNAEKRLAIGTIFADPEMHKLTDTEISEMCGCSPPTVAKVRKEHSLSSNYEGQPRNARSRHGARRSLNVSNLGARRNGGDGSSPDQATHAHVALSGAEPANGRIGRDDDRAIAPLAIAAAAFRSDDPPTGCGEPPELIVQRLVALTGASSNPERFGQLVAQSADPAVGEAMQTLFRWMCAVFEAYLEGAERPQQPVAKEADDARK